MDIKQNLLTINKMSRPGDKINKVQKIVIHYVENPGSSAEANRNYFENLKNQNKVFASAHYIIGLDGEIIQAIPDDEIAYHSGNKDMNNNSIGIEFAHPDKTGKPNEKTLKSLIELLTYLIKKNKLNPLTDIIRHYDVTSKNCPKYYVENKMEFEKLKNEVLKNIK